ncbi:MAG: hypothetical protein FWC75_03045 [Oscillospiraceae bacterium]|nr:hypothetical protein [Oscillospiraceae bacterium]
MRSRSKSTLFLIEQLIVIAVFAICAAACISILANAYFLARDSRDISNALLAAESVAETVRATSGDFDLAAQIGGWPESFTERGTQARLVFFDSNWQMSDFSDAEYILRLIDSSSLNPHLLSFEISVSRTTGDELVTFPLAIFSPS